MFESNDRACDPLQREVTDRQLLPSTQFRALSWAGGDLAGYLLLYKMIHDMPNLLDVHANDTALTPLRQERRHVWNEPSNISNTMGVYPLGSIRQ